MFFQLIGKVSPGIWRVLYNYYKISKIMVKYKDNLSQMVQTTEGVKQGGVLSPYLFNFSLNTLIKNCVSLGIGAKLGSANVCIIAYADDVLLMGSVKSHIDALLEVCFTFSKTWKSEFNSKKSEHLTIGPAKCQKEIFRLDNLVIPTVEGLVYLGLPIGNQKYIDNFFGEKFCKVERSMYSLRQLGCKPFHLSPASIAYCYKQYCQSQFKYGLETLQISSSKLNELEIRQNILVKSAIGLGKFARTKPLFQNLKINTLNQLYMKHKFFFLRQIEENSLVKNIISFLAIYYVGRTIPTKSFLNQLEYVESRTCNQCTAKNAKEMLRVVDKLFECDNHGLVDSIGFIIHKMSNTQIYDEQNNLLVNLKQLLYVSFY